MNYKKLFTSESVTEGHPDKISDLISDAILDAFLEKDPLARVACEVTVTTGLVVVVGEITTTAQIDIQKSIKDSAFDAETNVVFGGRLGEYKYYDMDKVVEAAFEATMALQ